MNESIIAVQHTETPLDRYDPSYALDYLALNTSFQAGFGYLLFCFLFFWMRAPRPKLEVTLIMNRFLYKTNRVFDLDASRIILPTLAWKNQFLF